MALMGGTMEIESAPGDGTTLRLLFPASRTISAPLGKSARAYGPRHASGAPRGYPGTPPIVRSGFLCLNVRPALGIPPLTAVSL